MRFAFGVTESFNQRNQGAAVDDSIAAARRIAVRARGDGVRCAVTLSVAFGCPFEGEVDPGRVAEIAANVAEVEPDAIILADTIGVATPSAVRSLVGRVGQLGAAVGGHFHNTRNTGYANALAALETGATVLDASVGGLGGCPFAPDATGNIATEDLVYLLEREGVRTGIELGALIDVAGWLAELLGRRLDGQLYRAGASRALRADAGGQDPAAHLRELELAGSTAQHDLVVVLEERPRRAVREPDRMLAVRRELDERSLAAVLRPGDRAGREEVTRADGRAVHGRMSELLRHRPVEAACIRPRDDGAESSTSSSTSSAQSPLVRR